MAAGYVFFFELGDLNNFGLAAPELRLQWKLSIATIGIITSAAFIGMFVGALVGGWFSDKLGRKKALLLTTIWYSAFSLMNALAWNAAGLIVSRFMTGVGLSAMTVVAITYISEMFPASKRGTYQGWIMMIGLFGIPFSALSAKVFIPMGTFGWRLVFVWGGLGIFAAAFFSMLEESPRWYENKHRLAEADAVLIALRPAPKGRRHSDACGGETGRRRPEQAQAAWHLLAYVSQPHVDAHLAFASSRRFGLFGFMAWVPTLLASHGFPVDKSCCW